MSVAWVHTYEDLESIGVATTEAQRFTVDHGGQVLVVQRLPAIQECGCGDDHGLVMADQDGQPMMLPAVFAAASPLEKAAPGWDVHKTATIADFIEDAHGADWRTFPSYVGVMQNTVLDRWYDEMPNPIRVWTGVPINDPTAVVAERLITQCRMWLYDSRYEEMQHFMELESGMMQGWAEFDLEDTSDPDTQSYWSLYQLLLDEGHIVESGDDWLPGKPIEFNHPRQYMDDETWPLWRSVMHQSRYGSMTVLDAIPAQKRDVFAYHERDFDPWL